LNVQAVTLAMVLSYVSFRSSRQVLPLRLVHSYQLCLLQRKLFGLILELLNLEVPRHRCLDHLRWLGGHATIGLGLDSTGRVDSLPADHFLRLCCATDHANVIEDKGLLLSVR